MLKSVRFVYVLILLAIAGVVRGQESASTDTAPPSPAVIIEEGGDDIRNYVLLGSDNAHPTNIGRTDVMVVISINLSAQTIAMLSLPRDLYVYVPDFGMNKINTVFAYGESSDAAAGYTLLRETILYNLGISVDGYARVNFAGFRDIIDALGGITIAVDCGIQDWRLKAPELDPNDEANWELFTLPIGMHAMDGDTALWYLRSRRTSSDFDRGRRHQIMLRAVFHRIHEAGLLSQLAQLWSQATAIVETNISLDEMLPLIPLGTTLSSSQLAAYRFEQSVDVRSARAPDGGAVQVPIPDQVEMLMREFLTPPTTLQIGREHPTVMVVNASGNGELDDVAAERLRWDGFQVEIGEPIAYQYRSQLIDFSGSAKDRSRELITEIVRINEEDVSFDPQMDRRTDFRVIIGGSYYACTHNVIPPAEATPSS
jgi:LCP family protein required for cell wall assembly